MRSNGSAGEADASPALLAEPTLPLTVPLDEEDQDTGDLATGVDEDALDQDELDTAQLADTD